MPEPHVLTELDSGIRVVTERVPSVRSVALGLWVRVGSRDESDSEAGISHFLEHMLFKGTPKLTAEQIAQEFDGLGAEVNAATSKEATVLHAHFLDEHLERAFEVLGDMLLRTTYADLESEREVVLEEIAMYEDEPQDKVHDILSEAIFGDHPLGRPVIGRGEVVGALTVEKVSAYHDARYVPGSIVVVGGGQPRARRDRGLGRAVARRRLARTAPRGLRRLLRAAAVSGSPFTPRRPSSTTSAWAERASPATTSAASPCRSWTRSWAGRPPRACSRRCARSAGWPTPSIPGRASTRTPGRWASTSARARTTSSRRWT